jgi:hypothetical protein
VKRIVVKLTGMPFDPTYEIDEDTIPIGDLVRVPGSGSGSIEEVHPGIDAGKRFAQMRGAFDDAMVTGREEPEPGIRLPDSGDFLLDQLNLGPPTIKRKRPGQRP